MATGADFTDLPRLDKPADSSQAGGWFADARGDLWPRRRLWQRFLAAVVALAALLRAWHLLSLLPIMIDETIYLRWAEIIQHQHQFFISLLDGKTPLSFWMLALARILFHGHPLLSARLLSVVCGTLSTWMLFAIGNRLTGPLAGIITSALYAMLPFALFYDRIAYTDTYVNLAGIVLAYVSLVVLRDERPGALAGVAIGLTLGTGYLLKPTAGLLAGIPVAIALATHGRESRRIRKPLIVALATALAFPLLCRLITPTAPMFPESSVLFHRISFFTPLAVLVFHPFVNVPTNIQLLSEYVRAYLTVPLSLLAIAALFVSTRQRAVTACLFVSGSVIPVALQVTALRWFPSRYVFPHAWPCVLLIGVVAASWLESGSSWKKPSVALATTVVVLTLALHARGFLSRPAAWMQAHDAEEHLGSGPFSGVGVIPAIRFLQAKAADGGYTLLTDPIWGPPADAMFPYLNQWHGVHVYDAWWMQLYDAYPILPREAKAVMKSQYERVPSGVVDFPNAKRVFYVTATNYHTPAQVVAREPSARLVARFPRPNGKEFVDVYQLR